jgi:adenylate kinase family enzyme
METRGTRLTSATSPCEPGRRISVVGTCGAGKTSVAQRLAERLSLPHIELDALFWGPDWTPRDELTFRSLVAQAASAEAWVIDGNYSRVRDLVWERAETVVWLDYSFARVFRQLLGRTLRRAFRREALWHGNRERLLKAFGSRESILLWAIRTHRRRRRQYEGLVRDPRNARLTVLRFQGPRALEDWFQSVARREVPSDE